MIITFFALPCYFANQNFATRCQRQQQSQVLYTIYPKSIPAQPPPGYRLLQPGPPRRAVHHLSFCFPDSQLQSLGTQDMGILTAENLVASHPQQRHGGNKITKTEMDSLALAFDLLFAQQHSPQLLHPFSLDQVL